MKITTDETKLTTIGNLIDIAINKGYTPKMDANSYGQVKPIQDWLYDKFRIFTWVTPLMDYTFTPYSYDYRDRYSRKIRYCVCNSPEEALTEALLNAIKTI